MALVVPSLLVDSCGSDVGMLSRSQKRKARIKRNAILKSKAHTGNFHCMMGIRSVDSFNGSVTMSGSVDARLSCIEHKLDILLSFQVVSGHVRVHDGAIAGEVLASQCSAARRIQVACKKRYAHVRAATTLIQSHIRDFLARRHSEYQIFPSEQKHEKKQDGSQSQPHAAAAPNSKWIFTEPRRPPSGFFLFANDCKHRVDLRRPSGANSYINDRWKSLDVDARQKYVVKASQMQEVYKQRLAEYKEFGRYSEQPASEQKDPILDGAQPDVFSHQWSPEEIQTWCRQALRLANKAAEEEINKGSCKEKCLDARMAVIN